MGRGAVLAKGRLWEGRSGSCVAACLIANVDVFVVVKTIKVISNKRVGFSPCHSQSQQSVKSCSISCFGGSVMRGLARSEQTRPLWRVLLWRIGDGGTSQQDLQTRWLHSPYSLHLCSEYLQYFPAPGRFWAEEYNSKFPGLTFRIQCFRSSACRVSALNLHATPAFKYLMILDLIDDAFYCQKMKPPCSSLQYYPPDALAFA